MGGSISVGFLASFRISARSYDAGLPLHGGVFGAILDRHPEQARENMAQLLSSTREFLERELASPAHKGGGRGRDGSALKPQSINEILLKGPQIAETKLSVREAPERAGKKEKAGRKAPAQGGEDRASSVGHPGAGAG